MQNNKLFIGVVIALVAVGSFYAGTAYGKKGVSPMGGGGNFAGARQQSGAFGAGGGNQRAGMTARSGAGGFISGEVLSKDASTITIKLSDGSSKIVFYTASTPVMTSATGTIDEVAAGKSVTVTGTPNADGSMTAQSFQLRPSGMPGFGRTSSVEAAGN